MIWNNFVFNKRYFHYISFFHDINIYFHSIKTNLYSTKYIFIISPFFPWYQNIFHLIKINLYSVRNIFIINIFSIQVKYVFTIWIFHWILFWWVYLVFDLYLQKSEFYFQYVNWTTAQECEYLFTLSWRRSQWYRNQSIDLQSKSKEWCLYDRDLRHERFNHEAFS